MFMFIYIAVSTFLPCFLVCDPFVKGNLEKVDNLTVFFSTYRAQNVQLHTMFV